MIMKNQGFLQLPRAFLLSTALSVTGLAGSFAGADAKEAGRPGPENAVPTPAEQPQDSKAGPGFSIKRLGNGCFVVENPASGSGNVVFSPRPVCPIVPPARPR